MPKEAQVTRTITVTKATVLCVDLEKDEGKPFEKEYVISGIYNEERMILKRLQKILEKKNDKTRIVAVKGSSIEKNLYGMTEQHFVEEAVVLPPRN